MAFGTTVVLITCVATDELVERMQRLRRSGHQPALLLITSRDEPVMHLDGLPAFAIRVEDTQR